MYILQYCAAIFFKHVIGFMNYFHDHCFDAVYQIYNRGTCPTVAHVKQLIN